MTSLDTSTILLTILGSLFIFAGLLSLVYQFFSSSTLTVIGIICLNLAWHWFSWTRMLCFALLWLVAVSSGFIITASAGQQTLGQNSWIPVLGALVGAIVIPIPFLGALMGVFMGALFALCLHDPQLTRSKVDLALNITFKSLFGLVLEVSAVIAMLFSLLLLAIF